MNAQLTVAILAAGLLGAACDREHRYLEKPSAPVTPTGPLQNENQAGKPGEGPRFEKAARRYDENNANELSNGKQLYRWYNCNGCHAMGGGGMGPALIDAKWLYGSEPAQIFASIMEGRPNGMPSFRGRMTEEQAWQLVAYVRSLGAFVPGDAAPGRSDGMAARPPENRLKQRDQKR